MQKIISKLKTHPNAVILITYILITGIVTIIFHENWRDEAQAWLIARDLDFFGILNQMGYEGHPPLWHIILMPFAKLGLPYITANIINLCIMWVTAYIIIKKAPFKTSTIALILFSVAFLYFYPTIARSYCLIPLAISLIAIYYPIRNENKIKYTLSILFLAYTHMLMLGLVGILYLFFFLEQIFYTKKDSKDIKKIIIAFIIAAGGLGCLALILFGTIDKNSEVTVSILLSLRAHSFADVLKIAGMYMTWIIRTILGIETAIFGEIGHTSGFVITSAFAGCFLLYYIFKKNPKHAITLIMSCLWQVVIYIFIYKDISGQKANTMFLIFLLIAWLLAVDKENKNSEKLESIKKKASTICIFALVLSCIFSVTCIQREIKHYYSDAKQIAQFIESNIEKDAIITGNNGPTMSSIIAYNNNFKFWSASAKDYFTYMIWDKEHNDKLSIKELVKRAKEEFTNKENVYLIESNENYSLREEHEVEIEELQKQGLLSCELYESNIENTMMKEETYKLYKINL